MKTLILIFLLPFASFSQNVTNNTTNVKNSTTSKEITINQVNSANENGLIVLKSTLVETQYKQYAHKALRVDMFSKIDVSNNESNSNKLLASK